MVAAHDRCIVDRSHRVAGGAAAATAEELQAHDRDLPVHANDARAIVANAADGARDMGAVTVVVHRVAVVVDEIVAVDVVDKAVAVVVHAVARNLTRVLPGIGSKVAMGVVDAGVDDSDHDIPRTGGDIPRFECVDIGVVDPTSLSGVVQPPQATQVGVVRRGGLIDHKIRLDVRHTVCGGGPAEDVFRGRARSRQREEALAERLRLPCGVGRTIKQPSAKV